MKWVPLFAVILVAGLVVFGLSSYRVGGLANCTEASLLEQPRSFYSEIGYRVLHGVEYWCAEW